MSGLKTIDAVILCGGQGMRLRKAVPDKPKVLAPVNNKAFLDILVENLLSFGFRRIILSLGYKKETIIDYFTGKESKTEYDLIFSQEETPLGTGGAIKKAQKLIKSDIFLVINGDSLCNVDLEDFLNFHLTKGAMISMVLAESENVLDTGSVVLNSENKITSFSEKDAGVKKGYTSAGVYLFNREVFSCMPERRVFSLEYDFFPTMVANRMYGYRDKITFFDIGTPKKYEQAKIALKSKDLK